MRMVCRWAVVLAIVMLPGAVSAQATPEAWEAAGLRGPTEYVSPHFGFTVTWDDLWAIDDALGEHAILGDPVAGDYVTLRAPDTDARAEVYGSTWVFWGYGNERDPLAAMIDAFATLPSAPADAMFEVLYQEQFGNRGALAIVTDAFGDGDVTLIYREFWNVDGRAFVYDMLSAPPEAFAAAWEASAAIALNGDLAFAAIDDGQVAGIVAAAIAAG